MSEFLSRRLLLRNTSGIVLNWLFSFNDVSVHQWLVLLSNINALFFWEEISLSL